MRKSRYIWLPESYLQVCNRKSVPATFKMSISAANMLTRAGIIARSELRLEMHNLMYTLRRDTKIAGDLRQTLACGKTETDKVVSTELIFAAPKLDKKEEPMSDFDQ